MHVTEQSLLIERRRVNAHIELGLASGAHDAAFAAIRSGAAVETVVSEHVAAAIRTGRTEEIEEALERCGISPSAAFYCAGAGTAPPRPHQGAASATTDEERLAEQVVAELERRRGKVTAAKTDLGDQVVEIIKRQGGL